MLTEQAISSLLLRASAYRVSLTQADLDKEYAGCEGTYKSLNLSHIMQALNYSLQIADYTSEVTIKLYNALSSCVGTRFLNGISTNPNAQLPGGVVIINNTVESSVINTRQYSFSGTTFTLTDWLNNYQPLFGVKPISVQAFVKDTDVDSPTYNEFMPDYGNVPSYEYVTSGVITSGIVSITWTWPVSTVGFIQVTGTP